MPYEGSHNVEHTVTIAAEKGPTWRRPSDRAKAMRAVADALAAAQAEIIQTASHETSLTDDELRPEFDRMVRTIRMFADLILEGSWVRAAIDRPVKPPATPIGPNHDLRSMLRPIGEVVGVFGASNFPLSYGVCGGDTASAWAAGCAVVVKEHPGHPKTGRLLADIARKALYKGGGLNSALLGYIYDEERGGFEVAKKLVQHPLLCAVGFTGSIPGGLAVEKLAREREVPIPVFAEMSSVNPVIVTAAAIKQRGPEIARELAASMLARYGQQCTCPGIILLDWEDNGFRREFTAMVKAAAARAMLTPRVGEHFQRRVGEVESAGGVDLLARGGDHTDLNAPAVFEADSRRFEGSDILTRELFGPAAIITDAGIVALAPPNIVDRLKGQLTATIYTGPLQEEHGETDIVIEELARCVGRLIFNGPPTGVRVATAMVHGGPFPATNRPEMTAVGPLAIERWCRRVCYQNAPHAFLPEELADDNPLGIARFEDGQWVPRRSSASASS